ncbi:MAG: hypothetical protein DMG10_31045 [Acidobacteria bacterium]|nr:MAG: hypothetical protein DMG10_31045 [Acidobacteriota bacterium]
MLWFRLQQLRSLEWKVRSQAAEKLGESKDPRAVEALVKALKDKDRNVREAAAGSLGRIGDASAVDALLEALKDYDQCVRRAAADALGMIRDERVIERLLPMLKDPDSEFRSAVARTLEIICGGHLTDRQHAACAVARMKWDDLASMGVPAIEPLLGALEDPKSQVRIGAVQALEKIGDAVLAGEIHAKSVGATALGRLVERIIQEIPEADLIEVAHRAGQAEEVQQTEKQMSANATQASQPLALLSASHRAQQELLRRGLISKASL